MSRYRTRAGAVSITSEKEEKQVEKVTRDENRTEPKPNAAHSVPPKLNTKSDIKSTTKTTGEIKLEFNDTSKTQIRPTSKTISKTTSKTNLSSAPKVAPPTAPPINSNKELPGLPVRMRRAVLERRSSTTRSERKICGSEHDILLTNDYFSGIIQSQHSASRRSSGKRGSGSSFSGSFGDPSAWLTPAASSLHNIFTTLECQSQAFVMDTGSDTVRAGLSPSVDYWENMASKPTVPTHRRNISATVNDWQLSPHVSKPTVIRSGTGGMRRIYQDGLVSNWDGLQECWDSVFKDVFKSTTDVEQALRSHAALLSTPRNVLGTFGHGVGSNQMSKMAELMYETFEVPLLVLMNPMQMAIHSTGTSTGCVVDCGFDHCTIAPIYHGAVVYDAVQTIPVGGKHAMLLFAQLKLRGCLDSTLQLSWEDEQYYTEVIKYACRTSSQPLSIPQELSWKGQAQANGISCQDVGDHRAVRVSGGQTVDINPAEQLYPTESLLQPEVFFSWVESGKQGLSGALASALASVSEADVRRDMCENVLLCGGASLFPGLADRLIQDLRSSVSVLPQTRGIVTGSTRQINRTISSGIGTRTLQSLHVGGLCVPEKRERSASTELGAGSSGRVISSAGSESLSNLLGESSAVRGNANAAWIGGSVLATGAMNGLSPLFVARDQYLEAGADLVVSTWNH